MVTFLQQLLAAGRLLLTQLLPGFDFFLAACNHSFPRLADRAEGSAATTGETSGSIIRPARRVIRSNRRLTPSTPGQRQAVKTRPECFAGRYPLRSNARGSGCRWKADLRCANGKTDPGRMIASDGWSSPSTGMMTISLVFRRSHHQEEKMCSHTECLADQAIGYRTPQPGAPARKCAMVEFPPSGCR